MEQYLPDSWVVIKINGEDPHYRVLAGWSGGYCQGDSWRLNSGITRVVKRSDGSDLLEFHGSSGSVYICHPHTYGLRMSTIGTWNQLSEKYGEKVTLLEENTDWESMDWVIG